MMPVLLLLIGCGMELTPTSAAALSPTGRWVAAPNAGKGNVAHVVAHMADDWTPDVLITCRLDSAGERLSIALRLDNVDVSAPVTLTSGLDTASGMLTDDAPHAKLPSAGGLVPRLPDHPLIVAAYRSEDGNQKTQQWASRGLALAYTMIPDACWSPE